MSKKNKLTVKTYRGTFTRTTARKYSHVVVARVDEERARKRAHTLTKAEINNARANFEYYSRQVELGPEGLKAEHNHKWSYPRTDESFVEDVRDASERIEGGFDCYVAKLISEKVARFEEFVADGGLEFHAFAWCGRLDLAHGQATNATRRGLIDVEIFPVEQDG